MKKTASIFATISLILSFYTFIGYAYATHVDIFIPVFQLDPKSPVAGQEAKITTVLTNKGSSDMSNVQISLNLDGVWIIDNLNVDVPSQRSVRLSFLALLPVPSGEHQLKACPQRELFGDSGHQCQTIDFVIIDDSDLIVAILSPKEEVLRGNTTLSVAAMGQDVEKVELYVQNELVDTKHRVPFDFALDTTIYDDGQYRIYAIAYYDSGISKPSSVKKYFIDNSGSLILTVFPGVFQEARGKVGQTLIIESDIENERPFKIAVTFIVLIKDSNGFTEFLSWDEYKIPIGEVLPMWGSWIPEVSGKYAIEIFLWDTIENSVPLSDVMKASIIID